MAGNYVRVVRDMHEVSAGTTTGLKAGVTSGLREPGEVEVCLGEKRDEIQ